MGEISAYSIQRVIRAALKRQPFYKGRATQNALEILAGIDRPSTPDNSQYSANKRARRAVQELREWGSVR